MTTLMTLLTDLVWFGMLAIAAFGCMFILYLLVDWVCDKVWGRPMLTEENRKRWWV